MVFTSDDNHENYDSIKILRTGGIIILTFTRKFDLMITMMNDDHYEIIVINNHDNHDEKPFI